MIQKEIITPMFVLALVICLLACNSNDNSTGVEVRKENGNSFLFVDLDLAGDTIDFDIAEIVDSSRMVRLENKTEALIQRISQLGLSDDKIYVYNQEKKLLIFDYQGKYHGIIGGLGKGPFEYTYINDLVVDQESNLILVKPSHLEKYLLYNLDGEPIETIDRVLEGNHILSVTDNRIMEIGYAEWSIANTTAEDIGFTVQNASGETLLHNSSIFKALEVRAGGVTLPLIGYPYKDEFKVFFSRDTLYSLNVETGALKPNAIFTASARGYDYQAVEKDIRTGANPEFNKNNRVYTEVHAETNQYFLLRQMEYAEDKYGNFWASAVSYFCIDKKNKTSHPVRLKDSFWGLDLDGIASPLPFTKWKIIGNRYAVLSYHAIDLLDEIDLQLENQDINSQLRDKLLSVKDELSEEDNDVVVIYYLQ